MRNHFFFIFIGMVMTMAMMVMMSTPAHAVCTNNEDGVPGVAGEMEYFNGDDTMYYCDGTDWIAMREGACPAGLSSCGGDPNERLVFLTSNTRRADGGQAVSDAFCQSLADAAGLKGTYYSWYSTTASDDPESRFERSTVPYVKVNSAKVADDWTDLTDGSLDSSINLYEDGNVYGGFVVATDTLADGTDAAVAYRAGAANFSDSRWTDNSSHGGGTFSRRYCFEQQNLPQVCTPGSIGTLEQDGVFKNDLDGAYDVAISGNYSYVASREANSLTIIDISNPASPTQTGVISNDNLDEPRGVDVSGNYAYVASSMASSLTIINISNPTSPTQIGTISDSNLFGASDVQVVGNYAYVTSALLDGFVVINISNPATPSITGFISDSTNMDAAQDIEIVGNYAYVASANTPGNLSIVDISNPASPAHVSSISTPDMSRAQGVKVSGNYAYVTDGNFDGIVIIDISNPAAPFGVGSLSTSNMNSASGIDLVGSYAYVNGGLSDSMAIIDISNPAAPFEVGAISNSNLDGSRSVIVSGNYAYIASQLASSFTIVDISNPASPSQSGVVNSDVNLDGAYDVKVSGNYAYVTSSSANSLTIIDISNPINPQQVGGLSSSGLNDARRIALSGNYAYIASDNVSGMAIIDVSNTTSPSQIGVISNPNMQGSRGIDVSGNYAYVASYSADSLAVIDISNPAIPTQTGIISNTSLNGAADVNVIGNYAYVASGISDSLTIIDISNPASPSQVGTLSNAALNGAENLIVSGNYAYVASRIADALTIIDISNPASPGQVGTLSNSDLNGAEDVTISGNYAYVASNVADALSVIDISDPTNPTQIATISSINLEGAQGVSVIDNYAYIASEFANSLSIINTNCTLPTVPLGLVGHWKLDETSGTTAVDSSPSGADASMQNGLDASADSISGPVGTALDFDGLDDRVRYNADGALSDIFDNGGSVAFWIRPDTDNGQIFDKRDWVLIPRTGTAGELGMWFRADHSGTNGQWRTTDTTPDITIGQWSHVVLTYDNSSNANTPNLYVNGVSTSMPVSSAPVGTPLSDAGDPFYIGDNNAGSFAMDAGFDDVRLYNRIITQSEIDDLYNLGKDRGLMGYWKLDETSGTTAVDSSGNGNDGTMINGLDASVDSQSGKIQGSLDFTGTNARIEIPHDPSLNPAGTDLTVAFWVKPYVNWKTEPNEVWRLIQKQTGNEGWYISIGGYNDELFRVDLCDGTTCDETVVGDGSNWDPNKWYHVAILFDGSTADITSYKDGVFQQTNNGGVISSINFGSGTLLIGDGQFNDDLEGEMDDVRVYDRALSAEEIYVLAHCTGPGTWFYNPVNDAHQWCEDVNREIDMAPPASGSGACLAGATEGALYYDTDRYKSCDSAGEIDIGK